MKYTNILFDLDGTLTDPRPGITKSVQYALTKFNIIEADLDKLEPFIGPPLEHSFMEIYGFSQADAKLAIGFYREYFVEKGMFDNKVYDGMKEFLEQLTANHFELAVATSKPTVFAEQILCHFQMDKYFSQVCGSNLDGTMLDKSEIITFAMNKLNAENNKTIMIGDRKHDIIGAHNNGIDSIGVCYGYGSDAEIVAIKPTYIVQTIHEMYQILGISTTSGDAHV